MKVNIDVLLKKRNKTRYWLSKEIGITYPNLKRLADNNTESIKFNILEKICNVLNCKLDELLIVEKGLK